MEILNIPMAIVHVFFLPMIAIYVSFKRKGESIKLNGDFLVKYCIYTSVLVTISKIITSVIFFITNIRIKIDSTYFAIISIFVAVLPYIIDFIKKNISVRFELQKLNAGDNNDQKKKK